MYSARMKKASAWSSIAAAASFVSAGFSFAAHHSSVGLCSLAVGCAFVGVAANYRRLGN